MTKQSLIQVFVEVDGQPETRVSAGLAAYTTSPRKAAKEVGLDEGNILTAVLVKPSKNFVRQHTMLVTLKS
jgi:hypothetical protein